MTKMEALKILLAKEESSDASVAAIAAPSSAAATATTPRPEPPKYPLAKAVSQIDQVKNISAVELQAILLSSKPRILLFDVRPLNQFLVGHVGWRSSSIPPIAGIIQIEPDWLLGLKDF